MLPAILSLTGLGILFAIGLVLASRKFSIKIDPVLEKVLKILPGTNCGACGKASCQLFADELVSKKTDVGGCLAGGSEVSHSLGELFEVNVEARERQVAVLLCRGGRDKTGERFIYQGISDCQPLSLLFGGNGSCQSGCIHLGSCRKACSFGAIMMGKDGLPLISPELCVGCGKCIKSCPKGVLRLFSEKEEPLITCSLHSRGREVTKVCEVGCIGCGKCVKVCPQEAIMLEDYLARIDYEKCNQCYLCVEECPKKVITTKEAMICIGG
ncbi:4Fe-4S dicluster domain-containing protein [candidate division NPL-UPA2 bacterium Unc8]|uniref:Ion-translocating oxidoreductase complex subunit B n=1 Tax=candidate division NPL-UPA2 bacterium Unc8 TaxID=1980939 RepID=A0A399FX84_UNCN2|nr:Electron transport complex subunit RsxB [Bacillota bacterium]RIH99752.1 MAG: 4Fe-4S dicluster domain-containing protein [candidate division NPL-UPA2 bacterium Unc8]